MYTQPDVHFKLENLWEATKGYSTRSLVELVNNCCNKEQLENKLGVLWPQNHKHILTGLGKFYLSKSDTFLTWCWLRRQCISMPSLHIRSVSSSSAVSARAFTREETSLIWSRLVPSPWVICALWDSGLLKRGRKMMIYYHSMCLFCWILSYINEQIFFPILTKMLHESCG